MSSRAAMRYPAYDCPEIVYVQAEQTSTGKDARKDKYGAIAGSRTTGPPAYIAGALPAELQRHFGLAESLKSSYVAPGLPAL